MVLVSFFLFNILYSFYITIILDRSLSGFIYFYTVENKSISMDIYNESYFRPFVERRFEDGQQLGFLECDSKTRTCTPTLKNKFIYYVTYPIGKLTGTLKNYDRFKIFMEENN